MAVMSPVYHRIQMHAELDRVRRIVSFFGLSFIAGGVGNALKAYFIV
jgi:hypothetical protein